MSDNPSNPASPTRDIVDIDKNVLEQLVSMVTEITFEVSRLSTQVERMQERQTEQQQQPTAQQVAMESEPFVPVHDTVPVTVADVTQGSIPPPAQSNDTFSHPPVHQNPLFSTTVSSSAFKVPDPPRYNGSTDPRDWLDRLNQIMTLKAIPEDQRVPYALLFLEGNAYSWGKRYLHRSVSYSHFSTQITAMFGSINYAQKARDQLHTCSQQPYQTVQDYGATMRTIAWRIPNISDAEMIDRFQRGLKNPMVVRYLLMTPPSTFEEAIRLADTIESSFVPSTKAAYQPKYQPNFTKHRQLNVIQSKSSRLEHSAQQLEQLKKEKKCFWCLKPGHHIRDCEARKRTLAKN